MIQMNESLWILSILFHSMGPSYTLLARGAKPADSALLMSFFFFVKKEMILRLKNRVFTAKTHSG